MDCTVLGQALAKMLPSFKNITVDYTDAIAKDNFQITKLLLNHSARIGVAY